MTENERRFTTAQRCPHCGVEAQMEIVGRHTRVKRDAHAHDGSQSNRSDTVYELLLCPACEEVTLRNGNSLLPLPQNEQDSQTRYPESIKRPALMPYSFQPAYYNANTYRKIDPVAYAAMLGHLKTIRECNRKKRL